MLFTVAVMPALLVASTPSAEPARRSSSCEKKTTLLTARLICGPLVATSALMLFTVPSPFGDRAQIVHGRGKIGERLFVQHDAPQIRDRLIEFFGGIVNALDEPGGRARDFLQIKRLLAVDLVATGQQPILVFGRDDGDILVTEKAGLFDDETRVAVDFAPLVNIQENRHAFAVFGELDAGNAATCTPASKTPARGFRPPTLLACRRNS